MSARAANTRRNFLKGGALAAAPLAAAAAPAVAWAHDDAQAQRLARLEDEAAIRALHHGWLQRFNAGAAEAVALLAGEEVVRAVAPTLEPDRIEVSADRRHARVRSHWRLELESVLAADCTLAQMAHAQGEGVVRRSEHRELAADYVRTGQGWTLVGIG